jgi:O-antigen/teichoic acid export membrane protein
VIFPAYAKFVDLPRHEFRAKIQRNRKPLLLAAAFGLAALTGFGDFAVSILYDDRYAAAAWMLPILALGVWPSILTQTVDPALFAIGKPNYVAYGCFWSFLFLAIGLIVGFSVFGQVGAVIAVPLSNIPPYLVITYGLWLEKLACIGQDIKATALFLALLAVVFVGRAAIGIPLPLP